MIKDKKILGREYIWGFIDVGNPEHCDFNTLTTALLGSHIDELRNFTKDVLYEKYRTEKLKKKRASLFVPRNLQKLVFDLNLTEK
jgi:septin family protein